MSFVDLARKLNYYILPLYLYSGTEKTSGNSLKIAYLGLDKTISYYWMNRLLRENYKVQKKRVIPVWKIYRYFNKIKEAFDLAIIEMNNLTRNYASPDTGFLLPRWLEMQLDTDEFRERMNKNNIIRRMRKYSFSFEKRNTIEDFRLFHQRMYVPLITNRHKDAALICDYRFFLNLFRKKDTQIGFIMKDGNPVAGSYTEYKGNKIRMSAVGILDGREDIMKMGVIGAIYYFEVLNCIEKGMKSICIGGTSPILTDGLTTFKLRLGGKAEDIRNFYNQYLWLIPLKDSVAIRNILKSNPFVFRIKNCLYRSIFVDPSEYKIKEEFIKYINHINCGNIKGTKIYCFGDTDKIAGWIKDEGYQDIQVMNYQLL
jgi:hypothetical protein